MVYRFIRTQRTGEGSLHPQPEGRGIRDPPRSRCNKIAALVDGIWQISGTPIDVRADNQYGKMTIVPSPYAGEIKMVNKDEEITLTRKSDIHLMSGISIRTADNDNLRYYLYRTETVGKDSA
jgi:hypothetical protein